MSRCQRPFRQRVNNKLYTAREQSTPLPNLHLPKQPSANHSSQDPRRSTLYTTLPTRQRPIPTLRRRLSTMYQRGDQTTNADQKLFSSPKVSTIRTLQHGNAKMRRHRLRQAHRHSSREVQPKSSRDFKLTKNSIPWTRHAQCNTKAPTTPRYHQNK